MTSSDGDAPTIRINRRRVIELLMLIVVALFVVAVAMAVFGGSTATGAMGEFDESLRRLFNPDLEANFATWVATALLLLAAALIGLVAKAKVDAQDRFQRHWVLFFAMVMFFSIDEAAQLHEMIIRPTQQLLGAPPEAAWVWTIPGSLLLVIFAVVSYRFLAGQARLLRRLLILAFGLYVFGAFGLEIFGGVVVGRDRLTAFEITIAFEEFFEMSGVVVLIYAVMGVLASLRVQLSFDESQVQELAFSHDAVGE